MQAAALAAPGLFRWRSSSVSSSIAATSGAGGARSSAGGAQGALCPLPPRPSGGFRALGGLGPRRSCPCPCGHDMATPGASGPSAVRSAEGGASHQPPADCPSARHPSHPHPSLFPARLLAPLPHPQAWALVASGCPTGCSCISLLEGHPGPGWEGVSGLLALLRPHRPALHRQPPQISGHSPTPTAAWRRGIWGVPNRNCSGIKGLNGGH